MQSTKDSQDVNSMYRELAILQVQQKKIQERMDKLKGTPKRWRRPRKPVARNAELWPEQAMMILGVSRRGLAAMLKSGQLADLHPYSIGKLTSRADLRLTTAWKKKYDYWKLQWAEYNEWQAKDREKRAENALKLAEMFTSDRKSEHK